MVNISAGYNSRLAILVNGRFSDPSKGRLSIFDLQTRSHLQDFTVLFGRGPKRAALSGDMLQCFIGCFDTHGLAAYSTQNGSEIWRRKDLDRLQLVTTFPFENFVFCQCNDRESFILCPTTGRNLDVHHGIKAIYPSPFGRAVIVSARNLELHLPFGTQKSTITRSTFAELDCAFSESEVVITESGGPVRCFDLDSAELLWTHTPMDSHLTDLSFCQRLSCFVGVRSSLEDSESIARALHFEPRTGQIIRDVPLNNDCLYGFCLAGSHLFSQSRRLLDLETGKVVHSF